MSTTVGNGLTVDGTVKASQATQAGEAVVLGDDGLIPANLVASGGRKVITEYTTYDDFYRAYNGGDIPIYSDVYIFSTYKQDSVVYAKCTGKLPWPIISGVVSSNKSESYYGNLIGITAIGSTSITVAYFDGSNSTSTYSVQIYRSSGGNKLSKVVVISEGS